MLIIKTLLLYILQRLKITRTTEHTFLYYPATSWTNVGSCSFTAGLYYLYANWNTGSPTGVGFSGMSQTYPTIVLNESTTGGARPALFWANGGEEYKIWVKCATASSSAQNTLFVFKLFSA